MFKTAWLSLILSSLFALPAQALIPLPNNDGEYLRDADGNVTLGDRSFRDLQSVPSAGSFIADPAVIRYLGYDPSRSWSAGDRPENVFKYGDIKSYGLAQYSLEQLNPGVDVGSLPLSELRILEGQTLSELVEAMPQLGRKRVRQVPPLKDNLPERLHDRTVRYLLDTDVYQMRSDLRTGASQKINYLAEQQIQQQNSQLGSGYAQGIEALAQSTIQQHSDIDLDLTAINNASNIATNDRLDYAAQDLERQISAATQNDSLGTAEINSLVEQEYVRYQAEVDRVMTESIDNYQANIEQEVSQQLADLGLPEEVDLDFNIDELDRAIGDFARETIADAEAEIKDAVNEELAKFGEFSRRIPAEIGEIEIADYDLSSYEIDDLSGAKSTPIEDYENYEESAISDVPGAADLSFDQYPFMPQFGTGIARVDWVFSNAEKYTDRTISGSIKSTFNLAHCRERQSIDGKGCAHVELIDELIPFNAGKQWVSGDSQEVSGGKNLLRGDGKEPTGRLPAYKSPMKMVLRNNDELTDTVEMFLALQICVVDPFGQEHCTPHDVLEIPVWTFKSGDFIFLGVTI